MSTAVRPKMLIDMRADMFMDIGAAVHTDMYADMRTGM
jgi:hypothetical protein